MSSNNQVLNTGQQATTNYDLSKIFIFNNLYKNGAYVNSSYVTVTLVAGTVMGRQAFSQEIIPLVSTANDGSQFPVGILAADVSIAAGATVSLPFCESGDVAEEQIAFSNGTDTLDTIVSGRSLRDRMGSDTVGVRLVKVDNMTQNDNQ